jgi:Zn-dependent protease with chaperone function
MTRYFSTTEYRYPNENWILLGTLTLIFVVVGLTAAVTFCMSFVFIIMALGLSYYYTRLHHQQLMRGARLVTPKTEPALSPVIEEAMLRLHPEPVQFFIAKNKALNAYTFGLSTPKVVVLHSGLFSIMDRDEIQFIIGHELGHVRLSHTWVNSIVGGLAGTPSSYSAAVLMEMAMLGWSRACEYSADRAGLLACGSPEKAISTLLKLEAARSGFHPAALERTLREIERHDEHWLASLDELTMSHPMSVRRIKQIRQYAQTAEYHRLQGLVNQNILLASKDQPRTSAFPV